MSDLRDDLAKLTANLQEQRSRIEGNIAAALQSGAPGWAIGGDPVGTFSPLNRQVGGAHYKDFKIQPAEFSQVNGLGFLEGCVIKRMCRWKEKNGIEDLRKAIHEIELMIEFAQREQAEAIRDARPPSVRQPESNSGSTVFGPAIAQQHQGE